MLKMSFELLNYHDQELMFDHIFEHKQSTLEAEELEPEPKESTTTISELNEWLGLPEAGIMVSEDSYLNEL
jgi:hypothetical protein